MEMTTDGMSDAEFAKLAQNLGLERFHALDAEALRRAWRYAQGITTGTPRPEDVADEPAHAYRAGEEA